MGEIEVRILQQARISRKVLCDGRWLELGEEGYRLLGRARFHNV